MLVRAIALSLALLAGIGIIVPLAQAESAKHRKHRHHRHYKKYSRAWWRQYYKRAHHRQAVALETRAIRLRQLRLEQAHGTENPQVGSAGAPSLKKAGELAAATLPSGDPAPAGWKAAPSTAAELKFRVDNSAGDQVGAASISVVGPAMPESTENRRKSVGGISTASLRRSVIDQMIRENGWVVNDYQKDIAGQNVYVVVAQSQAKNGGVQSRMFYFTEVDGRIYSVATNSPVQEATRLAEESEKVINSLKTRVHPAQRAAVK